MLALEQVQQHASLVVDRLEQVHRQALAFRGRAAVVVIAEADRIVTMTVAKLLDQARRDA